MTGLQKGWTPLHAAGAAGHVDVVKMLLDAGANPNSTDKAGSTPLIVSAGAGHRKVVKEMLKYEQVKINATDLVRATNG